jgi:hypothetical protein
LTITKEMIARVDEFLLFKKRRPQNKKQFVQTYVRLANYEDHMMFCNRVQRPWLPWLQAICQGNRNVKQVACPTVISAKSLSNLY